MKMSEKQKLIMFRVLLETLAISDNGAFFGIDQHERLALYNEILDQQDEEIYDRAEPAQAPNYAAPIVVPAHTGWPHDFTLINPTKIDPMRPWCEGETYFGDRPEDIGTAITLGAKDE